MGKSFRCKLGIHKWEVGASGIIILCKFCGIGKHKRKDRGSRYGDPDTGWRGGLDGGP